MESRVELFWERMGAESRHQFEPAAGMVVHGMPNEVYQAMPGVSKSRLLRILESPFQFLHGQTEETEAMAFGSLAHTLLLEPETFMERYAVMPEGMKKDKRHKAYQEFLADCGEREPIKQAAVSDATALVKAVRAHPKWQQYEGDTDSVRVAEASIWWTDPETGILCKARPDLLVIPNRPEEPLTDFDLKTFPGVPTYEAIQRQGEKYLAWPEAAYFYTTGVSAVYGRPCDFVVIAAQKVPPFEVSGMCYTLGGVVDEVWRYGEKRCRAALERLAQCLKLDRWPPAIVDANQDVAFGKMELSVWAAKELQQ